VYHGWIVTKTRNFVTNLGVVRGTWRLWLGIAAIVFMGVPVMQVFSWIVGGF